MTAALLLVALMASQASAADSLRALAVRSPGAPVVAAARARPAVVREALGDALQRAARAPGGGDGELSAARALAAGYATAWRDSFLVREVDRFARWSPGRRTARLVADSLRRAGIAAYGRDGPMAALPLWRRALARSAAIPDSAGMAASLGNIGAAHLALRQEDSAEIHLGRAAALAEAVGDLRVQANAIGALAGLAHDRGQTAAAHGGYSRALGLRERIGDSRGIAADHNNLGLLAQDLGDLKEARAHFRRALAINRADRRDDAAATNLVNLAALASLDGEFEAAERMYGEALSAWRALEFWSEAAAGLDGLGQLEMRRGDYPAARDAFLEAIGVYARTGQLAEQLAVERLLASTLAGAGQLQEAIDRLQRAGRLADSAAAPPDLRGGLALVRADLAVELNDLPAAERLYREAERLFREAGKPALEAEAEQGLAVLFLSRNDAASASALLESALRTQRASGLERSAALTGIALGQVAAGRNDLAAARTLLAGAARELEALGDPVAAAMAHAARGDLEAAAGLPAAAAQLYQVGLDRLGDRVAPEVTWRLRAGLGRSWRARGMDDRAARELRLALAALERPARSLLLAERRSAFLADKLSVPAELARIEHARGRPGDAFGVSETLRAREFLEVLGRGPVGTPPRVPVALARREQDLRRRLAELSAEPSDGAGPGGLSLRGPESARPPVATREALLQAQADYAELMREIGERAPRHAELVGGRTAGWRDVARRLGRREALIEYLTSDSGTVAFIVTADTVVSIDLGVRRRQLARSVEFVRGILEQPGPARRDSLWRGALHRLHGELIAPLEATGLLRGVRRLVLVPHAELHYLPFAALRDGPVGGRYLVERYELEVVPSASVWLALGNRPPRARTGAAAAFAPRLAALPGSGREAAAVVRLLGGSAIAVTGSAATEARFRREAAGRRVLHLATFGVLNRHNPLFSYVELGSGDGQDGRLEVREIFGLDLDAELVVLSACQTALGSGSIADVPAGDDWVGLTRAFLHAGADRVLATLWQVDDQSTAQVMELFYREYAKDADAVRALSAAQRAALAEPSLAHPFQWAGLVVAGKAGAQTDAR